MFVGKGIEERIHVNRHIGLGFGSWELEGDVGESKALENDLLPLDGVFSLIAQTSNGPPAGQGDIGGTECNIALEIEDSHVAQSSIIDSVAAHCWSVPLTLDQQSNSWGRYWFQCLGYDYTAYMGYMDLAVLSQSEKAIKSNHSLTHISIVSYAHRNYFY